MAGHMYVGGGVQMLRSQYLAGFREESKTSHPWIPMLDEKAEFTIDGNIDTVAEAHPDLRPALFNDVKVCGKCSKPCAFTMTNCNSCGASLEDIPISKSENVFSAFLLGVRQAKAGFPYRISVRRQTEEVLVMDDLLALTPCHFNAIPKRFYIPDWRYLLIDPQQSVALLDTLENECWTATQPFLQDAAFRKAIFRGDVPDEEIRKRVIRSFNFPPSQFQLHIQWLVPPLVPFQHYMAEVRNHFHEGRSFPMEYVRKVLELDKPFKVEKTTPIEDIVQYYDSLGVNYSNIWTAFYEECLQSSMELQNWNVKDFQYVVQDGKVHEFSVSEGKLELGEVTSLTPSQVQVQDKLALQNYGRPYTADGKASGTYIKAPLQPKIGEGGFGEWPGVNLAATEAGAQPVS
eukprot:CAMPEP_0171102286 /NCGR_PEP_ID=MMETSP0766_2-20121228/57387_1 /TAXON_ID=439317 /ORGANISM="Gambierdiscus australes, Strain CAWD 149" /LENGTH=402 /DNA_ID=CAMNT_0011562533 /DNA_START=65 /DNA_END=1273 /DNA_ORIENTATION=+